MDHVIVFVSVVMAAGPMLAMLFFIWWVDRYDREPLRFVFIAFLWGGIGAIVLSLLLSQWGIKVWGSAIYNYSFDASSVVVAPVVEELMKGLIVFILLKSRNFDTVTDGLVYGAATGLGFGMTENFLYFTGFSTIMYGDEWLNLLFVRSMMTANMHCAASATFGAGISKLKEHGARAILYVVGAYIIAVLIHGTWNYLVTSGSVEHWDLAVSLLFICIVIIFIIFVFGIRGERKQREKVLDEEFDLGVLPPAYKSILMSYNKMRKSGWFPRFLNKTRYLELTSRLALRKGLYYRAEGKRKEALQKEVVEIRKELRKFSELIDASKTKVSDV